MRGVTFFPALCILAASLAASACGDGGVSQPTTEPTAPQSPEASPTVGPAELSIEKSFSTIEGGELRFTLIVTNTGESPALDVTIRDTWQEGLVINRVQEVDGELPSLIDGTVLELVVTELPPAARKRLVYDAACNESGSWVNMAEVTAANLDEPVSRQITVDCP